MKIVQFLHDSMMQNMTFQYKLLLTAAAAAVAAGHKNIKQ